MRHINKIIPIVRFKSFAIQMCSEENRLAAKLVGTTVTGNSFKPVLNFPQSYICWSKFHIEGHSCDSQIISQITAFATIALARPTLSAI